MLWNNLNIFTKTIYHTYLNILGNRKYIYVPPSLLAIAVAMAANDEVLSVDVCIGAPTLVYLKVNLVDKRKVELIAVCLAK